MYWYENFCVPENVTGRVICAHHAEIGHVGKKKLWKEMQRWYNFAPGAQAEKFLRFSDCVGGEDKGPAPISEL